MCPGCNWVPPGLSLFPGSCRRQQFRLLIGSIIAVLQWPLQPDSPACTDLQVLFHFFLAHLLMKYTVENDLLEIILQEQQYGSSIKDIRYLIYDSGDFCWSLGHLRKNKIVLTFQIHDWKKRKKSQFFRLLSQLKHISFHPCLSCRAEPILQRIKEDRTRVVSPSFDNIKYDTFEIEEYPLSAQGFDWELWCRYLNPPKSWWAQRNHTAPIR